VVHNRCHGTGLPAVANTRYVWRPRPESRALRAHEYHRAACAAKCLAVRTIIARRFAHRQSQGPRCGQQWMCAPPILHPPPRGSLPAACVGGWLTLLSLGV